MGNTYRTESDLQPRAVVDACEEAGLDNILWECECPRSDSYWPNRRKVAGLVLMKIPDEDVHKIGRAQCPAGV